MTTMITNQPVPPSQTTPPIREFLISLQQQQVKLWVEGDQLRCHAPRGVLTAPLVEQLKTRKAEILQFLGKVAHRAEAPPIQPVPRQQRLPLSFAQERLWVLDQMGLEEAYVMPAALRLRGSLNIAALQQSLSEIVRRHESLRTTFVRQQGVASQVIQPPTPLALPVIDLRHLAGEQQWQAVVEQANAEAHRPFNLASDLMLRATLIWLGCPQPVSPQNRSASACQTEDFVLLFTMHHIATDGWSMGVLINELTTLYRAFLAGNPSPLPALAIQYADFAHWQRGWLSGAVLEEHLAYWRKQLRDAPQRAQLPSDHPYPRQATLQGQMASLRLEADLSQALQKLSQQQGTTLFTTLLAAFNLLIARYSDQEDVLISTAIANRTQQASEPLIGFFVNLLVLRNDLRGNPSFAELLARVHQVTQDAYAHQDLPFEKVVDALQPQRIANRNAFTQIGFALQNAPMHTFALPELQVEILELQEQHASRNDLEVHLWEAEGTLQGRFLYSSDLFAAATIQRMIGHFQTLLRAAVADPNQPIAALPLLTPAERQQLLVDWNTTSLSNSAGELVEPAASNNPINGNCIHHRFEAQVECAPDALAVIMAGGNEMARLSDGAMGQGDDQSPNLLISQSLTYAELNARANQLAQHLQSLGVGPETLVGICVERSPAMVVGLLGILKAGGAYVPLDPTYPAERLAFILQDAAPSVIVTQSLYQQLFPPTTRLVCLDTDATLIDEQPTHNLGTAVSPPQLAYVIYTSGSTGQPKGVLLEQGGLANLAQAQIQAFGVQAGDRVLQVASLNFDASISEIVMALGAGATLVLATTADLLPGPALTQTLQQQAITHVTLVPTALSLLDPEALPGLHTLIVAGEACPAALAARWAQGRRFFNAYGPTESTVCATILAGTAWRDPRQPPPIGRPLANTQVYVLDRTHQPTPVGVPGELYIGGIGVARGYLNRPELTAEKFVCNPFGPGRLYKTGDLVRWLPDGNLEYLGRIDQQVKLRGFRIELGEIEAVLRQHPAVQEAVVIAREDTPGEKRLVAYMVIKPETGDQRLETHGSTDRRQSPVSSLQSQALRSHLQAKLPDYMLPSAFVELERLPLTPNGKVDRKALPALVNLRSSQDKTFVAPRTATERALADIWSAVLGVEQIGIHDNFFEVGGNSLLTLHLLQRIQESFVIALPIQRLFAEPTIAGIAPLIDAAQPASSAPTVSTSPSAHQAAPSCLVPLRTGGTHPPFFCVHPLAGVVFPYYELAYHLGAEQPVYGLQSVGLVGQEAPLPSLDAMAAHYVAALQTVQPTGPYYLGGWSLGGLVAYIMAQQLEAAGETVACLAILDTPAPSDALTITPTDALRIGVKTLAPAIGAYFIDYWKLWRQRQSALTLPPPHRLLRVTLASVRASRQVLLQSYPGPVTLLRSTQDFGAIAHRPDLGWGDFARGGVDVVPVPGDHMTLVRQPHVPIVAERLAACLAKARQRSVL